MSEEEYAPITEKQLDALEAGSDVDLYNAVLDHIELIFARPGEAQQHSTAVQTRDGIALRLPVVGHPPYKIFWTSAGPRVEAISLIHESTGRRDDGPSRRRGPG